MHIGVSLLSHPTQMMKLTFSQWMGCAKFIWNAKCDEEKYQARFAKKYLPIGTYPEIDQTFSQYKNTELSPWLYECPSQILRNSAVNWYKTYRKFLKGQCGKPKRKKKSDTASIHLTKELFKFEKCADGVTRLFIGTKTNNVGYLSIKNHTSYKEPDSLYIKRKNGRYTVSFCYDDGVKELDIPTLEEHLDYLKGCSKEELEECTLGVDRGITRPVQAGEHVFKFSKEETAKKKSLAKHIKRCQRRLSKQKKGSKRRDKIKRRLAKCHDKIGNIRKDFCHKTSRSIVNIDKIKVIVLEDLKTSNMTKKPKPQKNEKTGVYEANGKRAKAGLNKAILDVGWYQLEQFISYKARKAGKAVFKVAACYTSQECSDCEYTHPDNRTNQERFLCRCCGYSDNADHNAAKVIKKKAIQLILHSGTELSKRGVLLDSGRGAVHKTQEGIPTCARSIEASKKKTRVKKTQVGSSLL